MDLTTEAQQTTEPLQTDASDEPTDADLIAAVQEAGGAASVDVEREAAAAGGQTLPPAPEAPAEPEEPKIAALLRSREKAFAERQGAEDYAAQRRQEAETEAARMIADARKRAGDEYEREIQARRDKFRESPTQAIRDLGFQTQDMVDAVTREGTPEWRALRQLEDRARAAEQKAADAGAVKAEFDQFKQNFAQQQYQQQLAAAEHTFVSNFANTEKAPTLHRIAASIPNVPGVLRGERLIIAMGHAQAAQWKQAGIPFDHGDVAAYLEHQARTGALGAGAGTPPQQVSGASGSATKVKANGSRTLSAATGSERRATPRPIDEMTADEERMALIEAAREARRQTGDG